MNLFKITPIFLVLVLCSLNYGEQAEKDQLYFKVEVEQNGQVLQPENNVIHLNKKPFKFKLTFMKSREIFVSHSWGTHYYDCPVDENICKCDQASGADVLKDCRFVSIKTGTEDKFNKDKDISVGDHAYHGVWFYLEELDWHRLDKGVTVKDGVVHAEVTVESIFDLDKRDEGKVEAGDCQVPVEQIDRDIYTVFAACVYDSNSGGFPKELQRVQYILRFE